MNSRYHRAPQTVCAGLCSKAVQLYAESAHDMSRIGIAAVRYHTTLQFATRSSLVLLGADAVRQGGLCPLQTFTRWQTRPPCKHILNLNRHRPRACNNAFFTRRQLGLKLRGMFIMNKNSKWLNLCDVERKTALQLPTLWETAHSKVLGVWHTNGGGH